MDILDIALKAGSVAIATAFPVAAPFLGVLNNMLPDDKKLPPSATGDDVKAAVETLTPQQLTGLKALRIEAEMNESNNHVSTVQALAEVDKTGNSTRPQVVIMMAWLVVLQVSTVCLSMFGAVVMGNDAILKTLQSFWPLLLTSMGVPTTLLLRYFGQRTREKANRLAAATGLPINQTLLNKFIK